MAVHSYWRLWFGSRFHGIYHYLSLNYLDFRDGAGASLCSGGTPYSSSHYSYFSADRAFPGGPGDWVSNNELPCWIAYHFTAPVDPAQFVIAASGVNPVETDATQPYMIRVQSSDDGTTWTDEAIITKPIPWVVNAHLTLLKPVFGAVSQHWLMHVTQNPAGENGDHATLAGMRFLNTYGLPLPSFNSAFGTWAGTEDWGAAWDGNPATIIDTEATTDSVYCRASYDTPVEYSGLYLDATLDGQYIYTPSAGEIYSSVDGLIWGKIASFSAGNATAGLPIAVGSRTYYAVNPPGNLYRRAMLLS